MTAGPAYDFRPLDPGDMPLIARWLEEPHVARWWDGGAAAGVREIEQAMAEASTAPHLVLMDGEPVGYIQSYDIHAEPDHPYGDQPPGTLGIDQFIGVAALTGKGHGPRLIAAFVARLFAAGCPRVVLDPAPDNAVAIRAYEKAGFGRLDLRTTPQFGPALLMARDAPDRTTT